MGGFLRQGGEEGLQSPIGSGHNFARAKASLES